jgi:hypothetical protein
VFGGIRVAHLFSFLCLIESIVICVVFDVVKQSMQDEQLNKESNGTQIWTKYGGNRY